MRLKIALLTTALAFGLGMPAALAEDAPGATATSPVAGAPPMTPHAEYATKAKVRPTKARLQRPTTAELHSSRSRPRAMRMPSSVSSAY